MAESSTKYRLQVACWIVGLVFLVLGSSYYIRELIFRPVILGKPMPTASELTTLFSGASSLALLIFSLILGFAALINWKSLTDDVNQLKGRAESLLAETERTNRENVNRVTALEGSTMKRVSELENSVQAKFSELEGGTKSTNKQIEEELRGRIDAVMGALIGTLHSDPLADYQTDADQAYLSESVHHAKRGYERLKELPGNGKYMALNNLVYYSSLLRLPKSSELLEQAKELRNIGKKYEDRPYAAPYLLTYARVMLVYGSNRADWQDGLGTIQDVLNMGLTKLSRREAEFIEASLRGKLAS